MPFIISLFASQHLNRGLSVSIEISRHDCVWTSPLYWLKNGRRAILAVLLDCGLRRFEVAALTFERLQQRDGVGLVGEWNDIDETGTRNAGNV